MTVNGNGPLLGIAREEFAATLVTLNTRHAYRCEGEAAGRVLPVGMGAHRDIQFQGDSGVGMALTKTETAMQQKIRSVYGALIHQHIGAKVVDTEAETLSDLLGKLKQR